MPTRIRTYVAMAPADIDSNNEETLEFDDDIEDENEFNDEDDKKMPAKHNNEMHTSHGKNINNEKDSATEDEQNIKGNQKKDKSKSSTKKKELIKLTVVSPERFE